MKRSVDPNFSAIVDGDGSDVRADMFAKFPYTPGTSTPSTPIMPRRRIRCKLCR